jgi:hypothetical protein
MKTLIDVSRYVWGKVRDFATVRDLSVSSAVEHLLTEALNSQGYALPKEDRN